MDQENDLLQSLNNDERINFPKPLVPLIIDERYKERNKRINERMRKELTEKLNAKKY